MALAASINCPNVPDGYCYGTGVGDGMYGYFRVDRMYGFGGEDRMYGGNESGWGDKMLGGNGSDRMGGNRDDDALYGGYGNDALYTGFGYDQVNAQDGQRDVITCGSGNGPIYIDSKLDVLRDCGISRAELSRLAPPDDLFAHTGKVLVDHDGD